MRTEAEINADLAIAYAARSDLISGRRLTQAFLATAESNRRYFMSEVTLKDINDFILALEQELSNVSTSTGEMTFRNSYIPLVVTKFGASNG
jgi:hypothetical protein